MRLPVAAWDGGQAVSGAGRVMVAACALTLIVAACLAPPPVARLRQLGRGGAAMLAVAGLALAPDPLWAAVILLGAGVAHAAFGGSRSFADRLRAPAAAAMLLGVGWILVRTPAPAGVGRAGAMALVAGLAAGAGLVPFLQELAAEEPASGSALAWAGFLLPVVALTMPARVVPLLDGSEGQVLAGVALALGLLNLAWGSVAAWRAATDSAAWHYSFVTDWGLALVGIGLLVADGQRAAYLILLSLVLVRLPLYVWCRPVLVGGAEPRRGAVNLVAAAALTGAAPFAGFVPRLLLLRAATPIYWPLAALLVLGMMLSMLHAFRLGSTVGRPRGRAAAGVAVALAFSLALGLLPGVFLAAGGL